MYSGTTIPISLESFDFTLHGDGGLTLHFPPGSLLSKSTVEGVIKLLEELEQTVKKLTPQPNLVGQYFVFPQVTLEGKVRLGNPSLNCSLN